MSIYYKKWDLLLHHKTTVFTRRSQTEWVSHSGILVMLFYTEE